MRQSHLEDFLLSLWRKNQVETLTVGEGPVVNQQQLLIWIILEEKSMHELKPGASGALKS